MTDAETIAALKSEIDDLKRVIDHNWDSHLSDMEETLAAETKQRARAERAEQALLAHCVQCPQCLSQWRQAIACVSICACGHQSIEHDATGTCLALNRPSGVECDCKEFRIAGVVSVDRGQPLERRDVRCADCGAWVFSATGARDAGPMLAGPARCWRCAEKTDATPVAHNDEVCTDGYCKTCGAIALAGSDLCENHYVHHEECHFGRDAECDCHLYLERSGGSASASEVESMVGRTASPPLRSVSGDELVAYFRERHQSLTAREVEEAIVDLQQRRK